MPSLPLSPLPMPLAETPAEIPAVIAPFPFSSAAVLGRLGLCLRIADVAMRDRELLDVFGTPGLMDFIARKGDETLIGTACLATTYLCNMRDRARILGAMLQPSACSTVAGADTATAIGQTLYAAATGLPPGAPRMAKVMAMLTPQARRTLVAAAAPGEDILALGEAAYASAVSLAPGPAREAVVSELLPEVVCRVLPLDCDGMALGQAALAAAIGLPGGERRTTVLRHLLSPEARDGLLTSRDPMPAGLAAIAAAIEVPAIHRREVVQQLLTAEACNALRESGDVICTAGAAFAAVAAGRPKWVRDILPVSVCAAVASSREPIAIGAAAYAIARALPAGEERDAALEPLLQPESRRILVASREGFAIGAAAMAASVGLPGEDRREVVLRQLLQSDACDALVASRDERAIAWAVRAAGVLPPESRAVVLGQLEPAMQPWQRVLANPGSQPSAQAVRERSATI